MYRNMQEENPVKIHSMFKLSDAANTYLLYLQSDGNEQLEDLGY